MAESARPRLSPNGAALLVLAVLAVALLLWQRPWQSASDDAAAPAPRATTDAGAALTVQFAELSRAGTATEFARAAGSGPEAAAFAEAAWQARASVGPDDVTLRYVSGGDTPAFDNGDVRARVEVQWPAGDADTDTGTATVQVRMRPTTTGTFDVVSVGLGSGALPVWLAGPVRVERADDVTVVRLDGGDQELDVERLAATARSRVSTVVPGVEGPLTVVSAPTPERAAALLGQDAAAVRQIAAISTAFDARHGALEGPVVVLNPGVFATMDARATQIVMTHEATHVLTAAVGSRAVTWVVEGFADFVALRDDDADLSVSAGQVLDRVAADGPPDQLPTPQDFDASAYGLGAAYESAWLAFRMLGEQFDDADVIAFYRSVLAGDSVDEAGEAAFGLDTGQITDRWRDYLTKSASTVS